MTHMIGQNDRKRKAFSTAIFCFFLVIVTLTVLTFTARADEGSRTPEQLIAHFLTSLKARSHNQIIQDMTPALRTRLGGESPRIIMNTIRLTRHALYNHDHYRLAEPAAAGGEAGGTTQIRKIQLFDRDGSMTLALFRLILDSGGIWHIDGLTLIRAANGREA